MSDRTEKLTNALLGQVVTLARLEAGEQQRITHRLVPLWSRLRTHVAVDDPTAPPTLPERLRRVKALVALVTQLTTETFGAIAATHQAVRQDIADWVQHETQRLLQTIGEAALFTRTLTQQALTRVVDAALVFGAPIRDWWSRQAATVQQQVGDRLRQGVLQEQPLPRLLQEVDAIQATTTRNTDTLTHGSLASVHQGTMTALTEANSARLDGVAWITTLDSRACPRCIALSGQSWTLDHEPLHGSRAWPGEPPLHGLCRCILLALPQGETVPRDQTFDHWLRQQPEAEQRAILGPARFRLWSEGKLKLSRLVDQHHRALTLEQLRSESAA